LSSDKADLSALRLDRSPAARPPRRSLWGTLATLVAVAGVFLAGYLAWNRLIAPPVEVELVAAQMRSPAEARSVLSGSGYVVAQRKAAVASKATGQLVALSVREGDAVKRGDVLARLEDDDIRAMLAEAEAQRALGEAEFQQAKKNLERQQRLASGNVGAQFDLELAEVAHRRAEAALDMAKARTRAIQVALENTVIRAPFDGTVLTKNADVGEIVAPMAAGVSARAAVVTLADLGSLEVEADVSESNIQKIALGAPCEVRLDAYPTVSYAGYVTSIIPTADRSKGTVMVKIGFRQYDNRVLPEMSAKVTFLKDDAGGNATPLPAVLTVPTAAIANRAGQTVVLMVEDQRIIERAVVTGSVIGNYTEIRSGLQSGDRVVERATSELAVGTKVEAKPARGR